MIQKKWWVKLKISWPINLAVYMQWGKIPWKTKLSTWIQEEIENLNSLIHIKETESVIQNLSKKKKILQNRIASLVNSSKHFQKKWYRSYVNWGSMVAQTVKHLPGMQETRVQSLDQEDPLEKGMETHPLQYFCLGNPMDGRAWRATDRGEGATVRGEGATVLRVMKSWTPLNH